MQSQRYTDSKSAHDLNSKFVEIINNLLAIHNLLHFFLPFLLTNEKSVSGSQFSHIYYSLQLFAE